MWWKYLLSSLGFLLCLTPQVGAQAGYPSTEATIKKAVKWIKANNKFGPDSDFVKDYADWLARDVPIYNSLELTFGSNMMKSGKFQQLHIWAGELFMFELSEAQARHLDLEKSSSRISLGPKARDLRETVPLVRLTALKVDHAQALDGSRAVTGQVAYDVVKKLPAGLALRLSYKTPIGTASQFEYLDQGLQDKKGTLRFSFKSINRPRDLREQLGPTALFLDLVTVAEVRNQVHVTIRGNTVAQLVEIVDPALHPIQVREVAVLRGHSSGVLSVAFAPDGKTLASSGVDGLIKLWDTTTHKERATLKGHEKGIRAVAFSPDGQTLASASFDHTVRLWYPEKSQGPTVLRGHKGAVLALAFAPNGKTLASASADGMVQLWELPAGKASGSLRGAKSQLAVAYSPDGTMLAAVDGEQLNDERVRLWNVASEKPIPALPQVNIGVTCVVFVVGGRGIVLGGGTKEGVAELRSLDDGRVESRFEGHKGMVIAMAYFAREHLLATASHDRTVKLWRLDTEKELATLTGHEGAVMSVAFSRDGRYLATAGGDGSVRLWELQRPAVPKK